MSDQLLNGCPTSALLHHMRELRRLEEVMEVTPGFRILGCDDPAVLGLMQALFGSYQSSIPRVVIVIGDGDAAPDPELLDMLRRHSPRVTQEMFPEAWDEAEGLRGVVLSTNEPVQLVDDVLTESRSSVPSARELPIRSIVFDQRLMHLDDFEEIPLHHRLNDHPTSPRRGGAGGKRSRNNAFRR